MSILPLGEQADGEMSASTGANVQRREKKNPSSCLSRLWTNRRVKTIVIATSGFLAVVVIVAATVLIYNKKELARSEPVSGGLGGGGFGE